MKCGISLAEELKRRLDLNDEPSKPQGEKDAGVLILLHDDGTSEIKVLLCVRSRHLRRHPGEVCFPGGMMDDEDCNDVRKTAIREAYEEVGVIHSDDYLVLGNLPAFRARFGILIHPTVALLRRPPTFSLSINEVESVFWIPLSEFLNDTYHSTFPVENSYSVHLFQFDEYPVTFGVTALLCIVVAIGVLEKPPKFDLMAALTVNDIMEKEWDSLTIVRYVYQMSSMKFVNAKI